MSSVLNPSDASQAPLISNCGEKLKWILKHTDQCFLLIDKNHHLLCFNEPFKNLSMNFMPIDLQRSMSCWDVFPSISQPGLKDMLIKVAQSKEPKEMEMNIPFLDDSNEWFRVKVFPVPVEDGIQAFNISFENITESKLTQLENEIYKMRLVRRNEDLRQFAYIISHNLRAPLTNILSLSDLLLNGTLSSSQEVTCKENLKGFAEKIDGVINDMNTLLHSNLRLQQNKELIDFQELVNEFTEDHEREIEELNIQITTDFNAVKSVFSFKPFVQSLFHNLLSNSVKYRRPDIVSEIMVSSAQNEDGLVLKFNDNGRGIDLDKNGSLIFKLYQRFHLDIEGTGMGLYMIHQQIKSLGGSITLDSQDGQGSEFKITLPY